MLKVYLVDIRKFDDKTSLSEALNSASLFRKEKYESFKFDINKKQSLAATYLLNHYLNTIGFLEKDMVYDINKYGKPSFKNLPNIKFSISHSGNISMLVVSDNEVGCDIEKVGKFDEKLIDKVLSDNEKKELNAKKSINDKNDIFYKYWVMKEAILKKEGTGLTCELNKIHDDLAYISDILLTDINEKYYFAIFNGELILANISINML